MQIRINIVFIVDSLAVGGGENHTITLFNHLNRTKFRAALIYLKRNESLISRVDHTRGPVWCADFGRGWDGQGLSALSKWLSEYKPRIIAAINAYPLFYTHLASWKLPRKPSIVQIFHTGKCNVKEAIKMHMIYRWFFVMSDQIVYVSDYQKKFWMARGFIGRSNIRIHNGIDTNYYKNIFGEEEKIKIKNELGFKTQDFIVGICAAIRPEKCHQEVLRAQKIAKTRGMHFKVLMIGDGPMRKTLETMIMKLKLNDDVRITGYVLDVRPYIEICDCLVVSSKNVENFSLSVLEAMSMGKAVIASNVGGIREQIENCVDGLLYNFGRTEELIRCISIIKDNSVREMIGKKASEKVKKMFNQEKMIRDYEQMFLKLAEK